MHCSFAAKSFAIPAAPDEWYQNSCISLLLHQDKLLRPFTVASSSLAVTVSLGIRWLIIWEDPDWAIIGGSLGGSLLKGSKDHGLLLIACLTSYYGEHSRCHFCVMHDPTAFIATKWQLATFLSFSLFPLQLSSPDKKCLVILGEGR